MRWLLPKEDGFFDVIHQQAGVLVKTVAALSKLEEGEPPASVARSVHELEHEGDRLMKAVGDQLDQTFVTPIDREDIHQIATRMDDVIDKVNLGARAFSLYGVTEVTAPMAKLLDVLRRASAELIVATEALKRTSFAELSSVAKRVKALEKEGDAAFRDGVAALFLDPAIDAKELMRQKEVLEDLEDAVDLCEDACELLAHIAVKHG